MADQLDQLLIAWKQNFADAIKTYLETEGITQSRLGEVTGYTSSAVNLAIKRPERKMSEAFICAVSKTVPHFSDAINQYRRIADTRFDSPDQQQEALKKVKARQTVVNDLREMIARLQRMLDAAVKEDDGGG